MIRVMLVAFSKLAVALGFIAEGALVLDDRILLALAGVPAVAIMCYATVLHAANCRGESGKKAR